MSDLPILNIAAYKFVSLDDLPELRKKFAKECCQSGFKGTILLSPEGINMFLAGPLEALRNWVSSLKQEPVFADLEVKESYSETVPFNRMLVKIKSEIIAFGIDGIAPERATSPKLPAQELMRWLDEKREVVLLDVRNDFEVEVGTFEGAVPVGVDSFRQFDKAVDDLPESWREKPIVMFCTGGIRCEKAGPLMERKGFRQIYQLDGGILKYFEEVGGKHWEGDCFVFDDRVALDPTLKATGFVLCYACQKVLRPDEQASPYYVYGKSCPYCYQSPELRTRETIEARQRQLAEIAKSLPGCQPHVQRRPVRIPQRMDGSELIEVLCDLFPQTPREEWVQTFVEERILEGNVPVRPARVVRAGEQFIHSVPEFIEPPVNANIEILWEDEAMVVVNKPAPLPVHPSGRFNHNTLVALLNEVYAPDVLRAAHRLDANTTGVMVLGRRRSMTSVLQRQFEEQQVEKVYLVRCVGQPEADEFTVDRPISIQEGEGRIRVTDNSGVIALTDFRVLQRFTDGTSLIEAKPKSGRTNQIRVHLWDIGHPVVGDPLYLPRNQLGMNRAITLEEPPMALHAARLGFRHPITGKPVCFEALAPQAWCPVTLSESKD